MRWFGCLLTAMVMAAASSLQGEGEPPSWKTAKLPRLDERVSFTSTAHTVHDFFIDDFDGDGLEELCELRTDQEHPLFLSIRELYQVGYTFPGQPITLHHEAYTLFPLQGSSRFNFATYRIAGEKGWIDLYNRRAEKVDSVATVTGRDASGDGLWTGSLNSAALCDINRDDRPDLLIHLNTGADRQPRTLLAYDLATKATLLDLSFAPMLTQVTPADLDGDGDLELVITLGGASDGPFFGPFSRDSSYVAVLAGDGRILAKRAFGGESSYVNVKLADLDRDLLPEIIAAPFSLISAHSQQPRLYALDGFSLAVKSELDDPRGMAPIYSFLVEDMDLDGTPEIIAGDLANHAIVLRADAERGRLRITALAHAGGGGQPLLVEDVDRDGRAELFFGTQSPLALWLVDSALRPLAWMPVAKTRPSRIEALALINASQRSFCLLDQGVLKVLTLPMDALFPRGQERVHIPGSRAGIHPIALLLLPVLLLLLLAGALYLIFRLRHTLRNAGRFQSRRIGVALVDGGGRFLFCNPYFLRVIGREEERTIEHPVEEVMGAAPLTGLLAFYKAFKRENESYQQQEFDLEIEGRAQNFAVELVRHQRLQNHIVLLLADLSESLQKERLRIWAAMAMRMAHKTKTPLATVLLAIQRLQRAYRKYSPDYAPEYEEMTKTAIHEIERVRDSINAFMKFARLDPPVFLPDDFSRVIQESLQEYLPRIPDTVQVRTRFETAELPVHIDAGQFKEALYNLLDNAIAAIQGEGVLSITTMLEKNPLYPQGEKDQALLEITDNGVGISAEELSQIFTSGFTTSASGTGMGLPLARSILESLGGTIEIDSRKMSGTTVFVRLPIRSV